LSSLLDVKLIRVCATGDSKDIAEGIIVATIQAFRDRLPELDWLDDKTRDAAEEKVRSSPPGRAPR
jgi:predicted metalloendopeptidase